MPRNFSNFPYLLGALLGAGLFGASAEAHECRALGQSQNEEIGQYWICVGFAFEDGVRPRAGTLNNLDFIPIWVPGNPHHASGAVASQHALPDEPLDTRTGDRVDFRAKLVHLKGQFYEIPHDATFHIADDWFFLKQARVGYSTPLADTRYARSFNWFVPVTLTEDEETVVTYRSPWSFVTPFPGLYAWEVEGTLRRRGQAPVSFSEKFVSAQPRIPYGPEHVDGDQVADFTAAPEGWFDAVRPANSRAQALGGAQATHSSPSVATVLHRLTGKK